MTPVIDCKNISSFVHDPGEDLMNFVGDVMINWAEKHSARSDVVIVNIGNKDTSVKTLAKRISRDFAAIYPEPNTAEQFKSAKAAFVVIFSDIFDVVSKFKNNLKNSITHKSITGATKKL